MLKLSRTILALVCFASLFGCSLEKGVEPKNEIINPVIDSHKETNTQIEIKMLRIHPELQKRLEKTASSRAYAVADKVKVVVKKGDQIIREEEYGVESYENWDKSFIINMWLPADIGYKMYIDSFNLNNSADIPTVKGESDLFNVEDGVITNIKITMLPNSSEPLALGSEMVINPNSYSVFDNSTFSYTTGEEYWYKIKAQSDFTEIYTNYFNIFFEDGTTDIMHSARVVAFNSDGSIVERQVDLTSSLIFNSVIGNDYYIAVIPVAFLDYRKQILKSESIKLNSRNFVDQNNSRESAKEIGLGWHEESFTGSSDQDFFKLYLEPGRYELYQYDLFGGEVFSSNDSLIASLPPLDYNHGIFDISEAGYYYIKLTSSLIEENTLASYSFAVAQPNYESSIDAGSTWYETTGNDSEYVLNVDSSKEYILDFKPVDNSQIIYDYVDIRLYRLVYDETNKIYTKEDMRYESDSEFDSFWSLNIPVGTTKVYLSMYIYSSKRLEFKLEEINPTITPINMGQAIESRVADGLVQYYSVDVTPGQLLQFESITKSTPTLSGGPEITGEAKFSLYDSSKTEYLLDNSSHSNHLGFVKDGVAKYIIKVEHDNNDAGNVSFQLTDL